MVDIKDVRIGDKVRALIDVVGGAYEPHGKLDKGEISDVVEIHEKYILVGDYYGFKLGVNQFELVDPPKSRGSIVEHTAYDHATHKAHISGKIQAQFEGDTVNVGQVMSILRKISGRSDVTEITIHPFEHKDKGWLTDVIVEYCSDEDIVVTDPTGPIMRGAISGGDILLCGDQQFDHLLQDAAERNAGRNPFHAEVAGEGE